MLMEDQTTDLVLDNEGTRNQVTSQQRQQGLQEVCRLLEKGIDFVKTKQGDATTILVGGGSIIVNDELAGVGNIIRPRYLEVANAIGAAVSLHDTSQAFSLTPVRSLK
jgi:hypothetical protein